MINLNCTTVILQFSLCLSNLGDRVFTS
jgi:hypothetical protein